MKEKCTLKEFFYFHVGHRYFFPLKHLGNDGVLWCHGLQFCVSPLAIFVVKSVKIIREKDLAIEKEEAPKSTDSIMSSHWIV